MIKSILTAAVMALFAALSVQAEESKEIYDKQCAKCHGEDGKGETKMGTKMGAKDFTDPKVQDAMKDDAAFKAIKEGLKQDDKTLMKPFGDLSDDQIKALITYIRAFKK